MPFTEGLQLRASAQRLEWLARASLCGLLVVLALAGCWHDEQGQPPAQVRIGVTPGESEEDLRRRYAPLLTHLNQSLDTEFLLVVPRDYNDTLELFAAGELDLVNFGGVTFVNASAQHGAKPLVMRDIDLQFTTYFIARMEEVQATIEGFRGRSFAFGSPLSTSGHFMPRYFLEQRGVKPENVFGSVEHSGAHDRTVYWVRDGKVDLGAVNGQVFRAMLADGRLAPGQVRVVEETPPYADYVWAVREDLNEDFVIRLRDAFLALSPDNETGAKILSNMGAGGFLPARETDFTQLRDIVLSLSAKADNGSGTGE